MFEKVNTTVSASCNYPQCADKRERKLRQISFHWHKYYVYVCFNKKKALKGKTKQSYQEISATIWEFSRAFPSS